MSHTLNGFTDYPGESFYAVSVPKFYIFINLFSLNRNIKKTVGP